MQLVVEDKSSVEKRLVIELPAEIVGAQLEDEYKRIARSANVKGFRAGHVPKALLKKMYGKDAIAAVSQDLIRRNVWPAIEQAGVMPITMPDVEPGEVTEGRAFRFTVQFQVLPSFELAGLDTLHVERLPVEVKEEDMARELELLRDQHAESEAVEDRGADTGDMVEFEYTVRRSADGDDAAPLEPSQTRVAELGKGGLLAGFEDHLMGVREGDERAFTLLMPADQDSSIAGQEALFNVSVRSVKRKIVPDLDDDFAKDIGHDDLSALRATIFDRLSGEAEREEERRFQDALMAHLVASNPLELPPALVSSQADKVARQLAMNLVRAGIPEERVRDLLKGQDEMIYAKARSLAHRELILGAVAKHAELTVSDADVDAQIEGMARQIGEPKARLRATLTKNEKLAELRSELLQAKAMTWLEHLATAPRGESVLVTSEPE